MLDKRFSKNKDIPWRLIEEEAVLVDVEEANVIHLNETGAFIWQLIDGKNNVSDILNRVCSEFEVTESEAREDTITLFKEMLKKEIIVDAEKK